VVPDTTGIRLQTCSEDGNLDDNNHSNDCLSSGTPSFDSEGQVQGRLEVKVGDDWVTAVFVIDGGKNISSGDAESTVACRQLGNELGYTLVSASKVGREDTDNGSGTGYQVTCAGTESTLDSCTMFQSLGLSINHAFDVGVSCTFFAPGDECEECVAGKFSNTTGVAACTNCAAGSYMSTVGATSCEQVRF
jgi:hypothetical protein